MLLFYLTFSRVMVILNEILQYKKAYYTRGKEQEKSRFIMNYIYEDQGIDPFSVPLYVFVKTRECSV